MGEDTDSVAAHLGQAAVVVVVVHEPFGSGRGLLIGSGDPAGGRAHDADDAVCAEPGATIGQGGDGLRMHLQAAVIVEQQDEVVLGAVSLDEGDIGQGGERGIRSAHVTIL